MEYPLLPMHKKVIGPAMSTMKGLKSSLGRFMPEADSELNSMTQILNGLMMDSLAGDSFSMETGASSEETERILQKASVVAEQQGETNSICTNTNWTIVPIYFYILEYRKDDCHFLFYFKQIET